MLKTNLKDFNVTLNNLEEKLIKHFKKQVSLWTNFILVSVECTLWI